MNPKNKGAFTEFAVKECIRDKYRTKLTNKVLFVTCESDCYEITSKAANIVNELNSTKEEADTGLILHASKGGTFLKKLWCCVGGSITR